eukprot:3371278-Prymnesium_polylepis.1
MDTPRLRGGGSCCRSVTPLSARTAVRNVAFQEPQKVTGACATRKSECVRQCSSKDANALHTSDATESDPRAPGVAQLQMRRIVASLSCARRPRPARRAAYADCLSSSLRKSRLPSGSTPCACIIKGFVEASRLACWRPPRLAPASLLGSVSILVYFCNDVAVRNAAVSLWPMADVVARGGI